MKNTCFIILVALLFSCNQKEDVKSNDNLITIAEAKQLIKDYGLDKSTPVFEVEFKWSPEKQTVNEKKFRKLLDDLHDFKNSKKMKIAEREREFFKGEYKEITGGADAKSESVKAFYKQIDKEFGTNLYEEKFK